MTREEQIRSAAFDASTNNDDYKKYAKDGIARMFFVEGAKWADNNPQQTEWIKFSDRLPVIGQRIVRFGGSEVKRFRTMHIITVDRYFLMDVRDFPDEFECWMPIPELPKEDGNDNK